MANFVSGIIALAISVVVLATVFISTVKGTNQTYTCANASGAMVSSCPWSSSEIALWGLLVIVGIAGMLYGVMNVFGMA